MEAVEENDLKLVEYLDKCRCCLRELSNERVEITEDIQNRFFELTQFQLFHDDSYSKNICNLCDNDLQVFSNFRLNLIEKQKKLYRIGEKLEFPYLFDPPKVTIKTELDDDCMDDVFVDCAPTVITIKHESNEAFEKTPTKKKKYRKKKVEDASVTSDEHQKLFEEFKLVLKENKNKNVQCPRCFKYLHRDSIKEHINVVHFNLNKFQCDHCDYQASRYGRMMLHMKSIHRCVIDEKYDRILSRPKKQCNLCGTMVKNFKRHVMKVHMHIKNVFCDLCSYGSFFKYDMEQHMKTHIKKTLKEAQKYFCEVCGLEFEKRFHLNAHVKAKHTEKERIHQCHVCEKTFYSTENLKKHTESHNAKDMPCEFCGKLFTCMNNLRTHLYYHAEPKFPCDFPNCDKKFYMKKRLRAHLKSHRGQKDFACSFCEKCYFSNNDLNRHMFSIHKKLRFFCEVPGCHGNFSRREYYKKHALAHHQNLGQEAMELLLESIRNAQPSQKF